MRRIRSRQLAFFILLATLLLSTLSACGGTTGTAGATTGTISVVAAENFYGDIIKQIGGSHVSVTSLLSDPNVDPHQYESSVQNGIAVTKADIVVMNGGGYDTWMNKLLAATPGSKRIVLVATSIAPHVLPDNPHVWYGIENIQAIAQAMTGALKQVHASEAPTFEQNLHTFEQALATIQHRLQTLKARYAGTPVGLTETIFLYQSEAIGLQVLTPFEFEKAVAEGNDPPADTVLTTNRQMSQHQIKILIYNEQTQTPITTNLQTAAKQQHIPIVPVTETMPMNKTYQEWMLDQLTLLEQALQGK